MRVGERLGLYALVGAALVVGLRAPLSSSARAEVDGPGSKGEAPAPKIAIVAAMKIADDLMDSDRYKPARKDYEDQLNKELIKPVADKLEELQKQIKDMDEKSPDANQAKQDFMRGRGELAARQREAANRLELKVSEQLKECYQLVRSSTTAIAEKRGFNYVISTLRSDDKFEAGPVQATIRELLSRPAMVYPEGVDITEDVREDLKL